MDLISIFPALWTAGADTATGTTDLVPSVQDVVDTMGEEVKQTSSILSKIFQPILDKLPSLIFAVLFLLIGMFLVKQIMRILKRAFNRSNMDGIMSSFIRSVAKIILYVLLIVIALSILDVPMDSIVAVIASAGVAIGLALKDSLSNLAGGFIILFSKPLKEGDTIEADGVMGKVEAITILYTRIVTVDNKTVFIPNGVVASGKIINYTDKETRRVDLNFGISYEDDIDAARAVLLDEVKAAPESLDAPARRARITGRCTIACWKASKRRSMPRAFPFRIRRWMYIYRKTLLIPTNNPCFWKCVRREKGCQISPCAKCCI